MLPVIPMWVHLVAMFATVGFAFWRGGREERLAASCYVMSNMLLIGFGSIDGTLPIELELGVYALEAMAFILLAARARRAWLLIPCVVACAELATAAVHSRVQVGPWIYGTVQLAWFYLIWGAIAAATRAAARRRLASAPGWVAE